MFAPCFFFVTRETLLVASRSKWSANTVVVASRPGPATPNLSEWSGVCANIQDALFGSSFFCWYIIEGFLYNKMDACERVVGMLLQYSTLFSDYSTEGSLNYQTFWPQRGLYKG